MHVLHVSHVLIPHETLNWNAANRRKGKLSCDDGPIWQHAGTLLSMQSDVMCDLTVRTAMSRLSLISAFDPDKKNLNSRSSRANNTSSVGTSYEVSCFKVHRNPPSEVHRKALPHPTLLHRAKHNMELLMPLMHEWVLLLLLLLLRLQRLPVLLLL